ncbi:hypothetical protein [Myxococcus sp. AB036A]|uniref:hypothetical protein n=1 Tax=Myxococcus sp. AB036A TaxID=2562793 RepID=UPI00129C19F3|nr:hypothetical protein [Myxococcus sp. AB036A]
MVRDRIARVAPSEATVLMLGESGTGEERAHGRRNRTDVYELLRRHGLSPRPPKRCRVHISLVLPDHGGVLFNCPTFS